MAKKKGGEKTGRLVAVGVSRGVKTKIIQRSLRCDLTHEEQRIKGLEMAESISALRDTEADAKTAANEFKETIKQHEGRASSLATILKQGWELRGVECEQVLDFTKGLFLIRRKDTMETVEERAMSEDERQVSFFEEEEVPLDKVAGEASGGEATNSQQSENPEA